jgi:hypothetical protein
MEKFSVEQDSEHVIWVTFKGQLIRIEQDVEYNDGNMLITVHKDEDSAPHAKLIVDGEAAEEDTEAFDRSFPELSNAAAGLLALKAMQDADYGNKIADMLLGPFEK